MGGLITLLLGIVGIVNFVCWVLVLIKMFQNDAVGPAVASLVLILCQLGLVVAFVYGWKNARKWNIQGIMNIWTPSMVIYFILLLIRVLPHQIGL
jgi:hypothetical protein